MEILAFPSRQFGGQEFAEPEKVEHFVRTRMGAEFPVFMTSDINGSKTNPVYSYLKSWFKPANYKTTWNFNNVYLVDRDGVPTKRLESNWASKIEQEVLELLRKPATAAGADGTGEPNSSL